MTESTQHKVVRECKVRGIPHVVIEKSSFAKFECLVKGHDPDQYENYMTIEAAIKARRERVDLLFAKFDELTGNFRQGKSPAQLKKHYENVRKRADNCHLLIKLGMEEYSGWGHTEHVDWVCDIADLQNRVLMHSFVNAGGVIMTDEHCTPAVLYLCDSVEAPLHLIYDEYADDETEDDAG